MTKGKHVTAGEQGQPPVYDSYGRLSRVPDTGELEKIETQHVDNGKVIGRMGGVLGKELSDGLSAWKKGVRRPGWEELLARVEAGTSQGIVVWNTDRLFRQPRDLEKLIDLGDRGFKVASAHGQRDLADSNDRFILRIEVAQAAKSSDDTSRRVKRRFETLREKGESTGGARGLGFPGRDRTWMPGMGETEEDRPDVSPVLVERERTALRDGAESLLLGTSPNKIAQKWNTAGVLTVNGRQWTGPVVRETLQRPSLAGLVEHDGVTVGRVPGEPILDEDTFGQIRALFAGRRRGRIPGERYVGSGIVLCGREGCGRSLSGRPHNGTYPDGGKRRQYHCNKQKRGCGSVAGDARAIDQRLRNYTIARLSDPRHAAAISAARSRVADRVTELEESIKKVKNLRKQISDRLGREEMDIDAYDAANKPLVARLATLQAELDTFSDGVPGGPIVTMTPEEVAGQWDRGEVAERRTLLISALGRDRVILMPAVKNGKRTFDIDRVQFREVESVTT